MAYSEKEIQAFKSEIIEHLSNGCSLKNTLDNKKHLPVRATVYQWLNSDHQKFDEDFLNNYARACDQRADSIFDEILDIADDQSGDVKILEDGTKVFDGEFAARSRIKIDARKWVLGRMKPKKYGEKIDVTTDGEKLNSAITVVTRNYQKSDES